MPLESTEALSKADKGSTKTISSSSLDLETKKCASYEPGEAWRYLFIHRNKLSQVTRKLQEQFFVFIHHHMVSVSDGRHTRYEERPTISGLIFVQGEAQRIQHYLDSLFNGVYLMKDHSTGQVAVIADTEMQTFIRIAESDKTRIRFMPHPLEYYAVDNDLVRITSGPLAGLEGYRIRIARDRCLITTFGGLTVALGGAGRNDYEGVSTATIH
jgi:transcription antitermination factor NusG